jgi:regulator of replication initiation timing
MEFRCFQVFGTALVVGSLFATWISSTAQAQQSPQSADAGVNASLGELQSEVRELKQMVLQLQQETSASRTELSRLRQELQAQRAEGSAAATSGSTGNDQIAESTSTGSLGQRLQHLEEDDQLISGKLDEQYQTKLESASKYRVRFSGIVLFNLFGNSGYPDNQDVPTWVLRPDPMDSPGSVGGTLRQSILGFEVFGPNVFGARSSGNVSFDFGGGFPATDNGVNSGLVRLRTAAVRLDWKNTSVIAGQDQLFISPQSPTSFASLIVPALTYSGNLWSWTPQLRVEHRFEFSNHSTVSLQGGVLDPLTGEPPNGYSYVWYRAPDAGEESRVPAFAARVAYSHPMFGRTFTAGVGGYYSREYWGFNRNVNGYAATADWNLPLDRWFTLSGLFYRGQAIGGLGAALGRSVVYSGPLTDPATTVLPLNVVGGWAQLKYQPVPKLEFNAAFGQDNPFAADIRYFGEQSESYDNPFVTRNRSAFGNVIYRPRSDLLFSLEYRRLRTFNIYNHSYEAGQLNMAMGILF